ncbi:MAG TPA: redox-sensing transcriptional repressor Rex [Actinomycetes bacterium]|nr:redox-sensing transcriptional repressor Rex [Actinomycetes bacterium]
MAEREFDARRARTGIPEATVARLPLYHRVLVGLADDGLDTVSSDALAATAGVSPAKLRKDLSFLGSYGTRGVGYDVGHLLSEIGLELGITLEWPVVVVGVGHLGHALANYGGFASRGFRLAGLIDADPSRVGEVVAGVAVRPPSELADVVREAGIVIGVIATPVTSAQEVADQLVAAGVSSILNFAPVVLSVADGVDVRKVDLASELQILAFHEQRRGASELTEPAVGGVGS